MKIEYSRISVYLRLVGLFLILSLNMFLWRLAGAFRNIPLIMLSAVLLILAVIESKVASYICFGASIGLLLYHLINVQVFSNFISYLIETLIALYLLIDIFSKKTPYINELIPLTVSAITLATIYVFSPIAFVEKVFKYNPHYERILGDLSLFSLPPAPHVYSLMLTPFLVASILILRKSKGKSIMGKLSILLLFLQIFYLILYTIPPTHKLLDEFAPYVYLYRDNMRWVNHFINLPVTWWTPYHRIVQLFSGYFGTLISGFPSVYSLSFSLAGFALLLLSYGFAVEREDLVILTFSAPFFLFDALLGYGYSYSMMFFLAGLLVINSHESKPATLLATVCFMLSILMSFAAIIAVAWVLLDLSFKRRYTQLAAASVGFLAAVYVSLTTFNAQWFWAIMSHQIISIDRRLPSILYLFTPYNLLLRIQPFDGVSAVFTVLIVIAIFLFLKKREYSILAGLPLSTIPLFYAYDPMFARLCLDLSWPFFIILAYGLVKTLDRGKISILLAILLFSSTLSIATLAHYIPRNMTSEISTNIVHQIPNLRETCFIGNFTEYRPFGVGLCYKTLKSYVVVYSLDDKPLEGCEVLKMWKAGGLDIYLQRCNSTSRSK